MRRASLRTASSASSTPSWRASTTSNLPSTSRSSTACIRKAGPCCIEVSARWIRSSRFVKRPVLSTPAVHRDHEALSQHEIDLADRQRAVDEPVVVEEHEAVGGEGVELGDLVLVQAVFEAQGVQVQGQTQGRQFLEGGVDHVEPHEPGLGEAAAPPRPRRPGRASRLARRNAHIESPRSPPSPQRQAAVVEGLDLSRRRRSSRAGRRRPRNEVSLLLVGRFC